jgi:hypothetical protein
MAKHQLHFTSNTYTRHDGTTHTYQLNDDMRITLIIEELMAIYQRESKRPMGHNDLPYDSDEYLLEAIGNLERAIEWPDEPIEWSGEPPMTMDEMHTAAWKEHQEMHR